MTKVESFQVYSDASGAPAVVSCGPYAWAFDTLGHMTCNCIRPVYGSRTAQKIALSKATAAYVAHRDQHVDADWMMRNRAMYETE